MKVICIDASNIKWAKPLVEGDEYEAFQSPFFPDSYQLVGYEFNKIGGFASYIKNRFVLISEIDETTFERNYQNQKTTA